jgi:hypothetical protein
MSDKMVEKKARRGKEKIKILFHKYLIIHAKWGEWIRVTV